MVIPISLACKSPGVLPDTICNLVVVGEPIVTSEALTVRPPQTVVLSDTIGRREPQYSQPEKVTDLGQIGSFDYALLSFYSNSLFSFVYLFRRRGR